MAELLGPGATAMGVGVWWGGCSLWAWEGITMTCKCAKLQAGYWEQSRRILWVRPWFEAQGLPALGHWCRLYPRETKCGHLVPQFPPL